MPIDQRGAPIPGWSSSDVQREVSHRLKRDGNPLQYLPSASTYAIYAPDGGLDDAEWRMINYRLRPFTMCMFAEDARKGKP